MFYDAWPTAQNGWLVDLQALGYKAPLRIPAHLGIQAVLATIEAPEIHKFIQDHELHVLEGSEKEDAPLLLETLGMQEFCDIAFVACKVDVATVIDKLKDISKDLLHILDQDKKELDMACEKARVIAAALGQAPRNGGTQALAHKSAGPS